MHNDLITTLAAARKAHQMTQAQLAESAGLSRMTVQRTEGGDLKHKQISHACKAYWLSMPYHSKITIRKRPKLLLPKLLLPMPALLSILQKRQLRLPRPISIANKRHYVNLKPTLALRRKI